MAHIPAKCVPCHGGAPALTAAEIAARLPLVPAWTLADQKIHRHFEMPDFRKALAWINRIGMLAEAEPPHPDLHIRRWNQVEVVLWTHAVDGLHDNDFVLARQIDVEVKSIRVVNVHQIECVAITICSDLRTAWCARNSRMRC